MSTDDLEERRISGDLFTVAAHGSVGALLRSESTLPCDGVPNGGVVNRRWKMFLTSGSRGKACHRCLILPDLSTGVMNSVVGTWWFLYFPALEGLVIFSGGKNPHHLKLQLLFRLRFACILEI
ncbi:hypothetical protein Bca4012_057948 [Brassica carinata]